jgi:hypothetical protein
MLYNDLIKIVLAACHLKNVITYLLEYEQELSLGMLHMLQTYIIFDAPCLFYTNCFMFVYTSWHFYAFYGTNLLTRCHSANSCFLLFLYFRKVIQEIFSELDESKAKPPIFPDTKIESKAETEEGTEVATPPGGTGPPQTTPGHGVGPSSSL